MCLGWGEFFFRLRMIGDVSLRVFLGDCVLRKSGIRKVLKEKNVGRGIRGDGYFFEGKGC